MIDTKALRRVAVDCSWPTSPVPIGDIINRLEAAEKEREIDEQRIADLMAELNRVGHENDKLRAKVEAMERQEPVAFVLNAPKLKRCAALLDAGKKLPHKTKLYALPGAQNAPSLASGDVSLISEGKTQPAPSVPECPYPCGWRNLLKYAIEDGAYLARSINEDDPVTENARAVTMRMVMRLRDVLMAVNNAAPEAKP